MRCLRVVTLFALVCGLAGVAHADYLRVIDPSDNPGPAVKALGSVPIGMNTTGTVTIKSCNNSRPMPDDNSCASGGGSSDLAAFNFGPGCSEFSYVPPPALPISITNNNSDVFTFRYTLTNRGLDTCVVTADANDADDTDVSFTLTGTGTGPELAMNPSPVAFGDTPLGMTVDRELPSR